MSTSRDLGILTSLYGRQRVLSGMAWVLEQRAMLLDQESAKLFRRLNTPPNQLLDLVEVLYTLPQDEQLTTIETYMKG